MQALKILLFLALALLIKQGHALDLNTGWHHLEPVMTEGFEALSSINKPSERICVEPTSSEMINYMSLEPKTETWRSYYNLPKLLDQHLFRVRDVCEEAKRMNQKMGVTREYALIANKNHLCDTGHRGCISTLKSISDPCNYFIQDNFQVFHTRLFVKNKRPPGSAEIGSVYGAEGPSLVVIRLSDCSPVPTERATKVMKEGKSQADALKENYFGTVPSEGTDSTGEPKFRSRDEGIRFDAMKEVLISQLPELKKLGSSQTHCIERGKRSLPGISDFEDVKYGRLQKISGIVALRKLADEQMIHQTGFNPYAPRD